MSVTGAGAEMGKYLPIPTHQHPDIYSYLLNSSLWLTRGTRTMTYYMTSTNDTGWTVYRSQTLADARMEATKKYGPGSLILVSIARWEEDAKSPAETLSWWLIA